MILFHSSLYSTPALAELLTTCPYALMQFAGYVFLECAPLTEPSGHKFFLKKYLHQIEENKDVQSIVKEKLRNSVEMIEKIMLKLSTSVTFSELQLMLQDLTLENPEG